MRTNKGWLMAGAASVAVLFATSAWAQTPQPAPRPAAQPAPADDDDEDAVDALVVTGSFLRGTPETAVLPVEGFNLEELRDQGSPSNLDFVKNLSEIGQVFGEANRASTLGIGQQTINLRSLGASRTVVVFNGRRMNEEYSFALGRSNNIATIPNCAIGRVEILKDGGGTTYGADAVGGVVNYITRRNFEGVEAQAQYRYIKGSDGDYDGCVTVGKRFDKGNIQGSFSFIHRSELDVTERDWAFQPFLQNPNAWWPAAVVPGVNNPGGYQVVMATAFGILPITPTGTAAVSPLLKYSGDRQWGSQGGVRDPQCMNLGGYGGWIGFGTGAQPACFTPNGNFENLVEESDTFSAYVEGNWEFTNKLKVHGELSYYWLDIPKVPLDVFTASIGAWPLSRNKAGVLAPAVVPAGSPPGTPATIPSQLVSTVGAFLVPSYAPSVTDFLNSLKNSNGSLSLNPAQMLAWTNPSFATTQYVALPINTWRPFGLGGGALDGDVDNQDNRSQQWRATLEFSGDLGKFAGGAWDWQASITHGWGNYHITAPDILIDRLQSALNGYGGPACAGPGAITGLPGAETPTNQPGVNGCKYFNPFSSAYPTNVVTGVTNPGYKSNLTNDRDLVEWLYTEIETSYPGQYDVIDLLLRGDLDYHLWSEEPIQTAIGVQYRERHAVVDAPDLGDITLNPCATPGVLNCAQRNGPTLFRRHFNTSGVAQDADRLYPTESAFGEIKIPITSTLNAQVSTRWEKYFSDLGGQDNEVVVSGGGIRWQALPKVALRATAQQSFSQANPLAPLADVPTVVASVPALYGGTTGANYLTLNVANPDVKPERGFNYNIGGVFEIGDVVATLDYYNISIKSVIDAGGLSATTVINAAAIPGQTGVAALFNCNSLIVTQAQSSLGGRSFFQLPTGFNCVQGTQTVADALQGIQTQDRLALAPGQVPPKIGTPQISFFGAQGQERRTYNGGSLDTSGIDVGFKWTKTGVFGGDLTTSIDFSYILKYDVGAFQVAGIPYSVPYDGIGYVNNGADRPGGQRIYPWRGSLGFNYHYGKHNFNLLTRYVSAISNNDPSLIGASTVPGAGTNANIGDANGFVSNACPTNFLQSPPIPDGAGTAIYGVPTLVGGAGVVGYNPCQNTYVVSGEKLAGSFNTNFTYRVSLPGRTDLTISINNVFDSDPSFSRDGLNYDSSSSAGPLGRTYQVGVRKTF